MRRQIRSVEDLQNITDIFMYPLLWEQLRALSMELMNLAKGNERLDSPSKSIIFFLGESLTIPRIICQEISKTRVFQNVAIKKISGSFHVPTTASISDTWIDYVARKVMGVLQERDWTRTDNLNIFITDFSMSGTSFTDLLKVWPAILDKIRALGSISGQIYLYIVPVISPDAEVKVRTQLALSSERFRVVFKYLPENLYHALATHKLKGVMGRQYIKDSVRVWCWHPDKSSRIEDDSALLHQVAVRRLTQHVQEAFSIPAQTRGSREQPPSDAPYPETSPPPSPTGSTASSCVFSATDEESSPPTRSANRVLFGDDDDL